MTTTPPSPFIGQDSPLDARQQQIVERVSAAEHASIVALPTDHPLDPKRRARDEATYPELIAQPDRIRETLAANDAALDELADRIAAMDVDRVFVTGAGDSSRWRSPPDRRSSSCSGSRSSRSRASTSRTTSHRS